MILLVQNCIFACECISDLVLNEAMHGDMTWSWVKVTSNISLKNSSSFLPQAEIVRTFFTHYWHKLPGFTLCKTAGISPSACVFYMRGV